LGHEAFAQEENSMLSLPQKLAPLHPAAARKAVAHGLCCGDRLQDGLAFAALAALSRAAPAYAAGSGMPWEAPLQKILDSIEGPVAKMVAVIIIIGTGLSLAFGDNANRSPRSYAR
jgi:type IV secretion system protein VirB2